MKNIDQTKKELIRKLTEYQNSNKYNNNYKGLLIESLKLDINDIKYFLNTIDKIINYNLRLANELFNYIINNTNISNYKIEINYLKNKINEHLLYNNLTKEQQNLYNFYIEEGRKEYKNFNLTNALNLYKQGKEETNHPIFDYYIGKMYFKLKTFDKAHEYISRYEKNGGEKELHALLFIWGNDKYLEKTQILYIDEKAKRLINCYDNFKNWKLPNLKTKLVTRRKEQNPDITKYKNYRKISMTENDFTKNDLKVKEFYNYPFKDKLILIRQLYNEGQTTLATSLLKELEKSNLDSKSRQHLTNMKKLMKIKK